MGVGHQGHPFLFSPQEFEKTFRVRVHLDEVADAFLEGRDIQFQFPGPEIDVRPVEGAFLAPVAGEDQVPGQGQVHGLPPGVLFRHQGFPEIIVEVFVQEGAVHVQEHPGYVVPGKSHSGSFLNRGRGGFYTRPEAFSGAAIFMAATGRPITTVRG